MWFQVPSGTTHIGVAGQNFTPDEQGKFEAPDEFEAALAAARIGRCGPPEGWTPPQEVTVEEVIHEATPTNEPIPMTIDPNNPAGAVQETPPASEPAA